MQGPRPFLKCRLEAAAGAWPASSPEPPESRGSSYGVSGGRHLSSRLLAAAISPIPRAPFLASSSHSFAWCLLRARQGEGAGPLPSSPSFPCWVRFRHVCRGVMEPTARIGGQGPELAGHALLCQRNNVQTCRVFIIIPLSQTEDRPGSKISTG